MTQKVTIEGDGAADYEEGMKVLEKSIPLGMEKLVEAIAKAAEGDWPH
jgi:hypothetical protein